MSSMFTTPPKPADKEKDNEANLAILESILAGDFDASQCLIENVNIPKDGESTPYNMTDPDADKFAVVVHNLLTPTECDAIINFTEEHSTYVQALLNDSLSTDFRKSGRTMIDTEIVAAQLWDRISSVLNEKVYPRFHHFYNHPTRVGYINKNAPASEKPTATGVNPRLRFLKYTTGDYFVPHGDGSYRVDDPTSPQVSYTPLSYPILSLSLSLSITASLGHNHGSTLTKPLYDFFSHCCPTFPQYGDESYVTLMLYLNDGETGSNSQFTGGQTRVWSGNNEMDDKYYDLAPTKGSILLFQHDTLHEGRLVQSGVKYAMRSDIMYTHSTPE